MRKIKQTYSLLCSFAEDKPKSNKQKLIQKIKQVNKEKEKKLHQK